MLTIQPNFTTKQYASKPVHFKGEDFELTEDYIDSTTKFYQDQIKKADELLANKQAPDFVKKGMKWSKIISEGVVDGLAVAWASTQGAKYSKKFMTKIAEGKVGKFIETYGKELGALASKVIKNIPDSKLGVKVAEAVEKLDNTKYGKYIVSAGKGILKLGKAGAAKVGASFEGKTGSEVYDKASKVLSATLGVSAGATGAYGAARKDSLAASKAEVLQELAEDAEIIDENISEGSPVEEYEEAYDD